MNKKKLDGYTLAAKMMKNRSLYSLTVTEQALFYELIAICNRENWDDTFRCTNIELCSVLRISESTLRRARKKLIESGLIYYKVGINTREIGCYSFVTPFETTVNLNGEVNGEVNTPDSIYNVRANKTETETKEEIYKEMEEIYNLYPARCLVTQRSTCKSESNKEKIGKLLKQFTSEDLKNRITWYINECKKHNVYMKNFSSLLNKLPEAPTTPPDERLCRWKTIDGSIRKEKYSIYLGEAERFGEQVEFVGFEL